MVALGAMGLNPRSVRTILMAILLLGLALRVAWSLHLPATDAALAALPDQLEYLNLGRSLHDHHGLQFSDPRFADTVYAFRMPGYPFLLDLCGAGIRRIRFVQCLLDASTILAVFLLARSWLSVRSSLLAALFVALNPYQIYFTGLILSESLFTAMLIWGMTLVLFTAGPWPTGWRRFAGWAGGAILLALMVLVRPGALLLPIILGIGAALLNRSRRDRQRDHFPIPVATTYLLLTLAALFPWAGRNRLLLHRWIWTTTNDGFTRYDGFNPDATGASDQSFIRRMPWLMNLTETARNDLLSEQAGEWTAAHPRDSLRLAILKIARTLCPIPLSEQFGTTWKYLLVGLLYGGPLELLIIAGLLRGRLPASARWFLLLPALYFILGSALSVGSLRYLLPAWPALAILAASATERTCGNAASSGAGEQPA